MEDRSLGGRPDAKGKSQHRERSDKHSRNDEPSTHNTFEGTPTDGPPHPNKLQRLNALQVTDLLSPAEDLTAIDHARQVHSGVPQCARMSPELGYVLVVAEGGPRNSEDERLRHRLAVVDALLVAAERRVEVLEAVANSADRDAARRAVARLLGLGEDSPEAQGVIDLRLGTFTQAHLAEIRSESQDIERRLGMAP